MYPPEHKLECGMPQPDQGGLLCVREPDHLSNFPCNTSMPTQALRPWMHLLGHLGLWDTCRRWLLAEGHGTKDVIDLSGPTLPSLPEVSRRTAGAPQGLSHPWSHVPRPATTSSRCADGAVLEFGQRAAKSPISGLGTPAC